MKRVLCLIPLLLLGFQAPAHAQLVDTVIGGLSYAQQQAYQAFMQLKVVEELAVLKQNYDASVRYYTQFEQLNQGKGILYNVGQELKTGETQIEANLMANVNRDFIHTYNSNTAVDQFYKSIDSAIASNMKYAGDEIANTIDNRQTGVNVAQSANGLAPKDAANLNAQAQGIQIQMLTQLHDDNLRLIQIQTMRLAEETQREEAEQALISNLQQSVQQRIPSIQQGSPQ